MRVTASGLDRAVRCPGSLLLPQVQREAGEAAVAGTWRHRFLELAARGDRNALEAVPPEYQAICQSLPLEELPMLTPEVAFAWDLNTGQSRVLGSSMERDYSSARDTEICGTADFVGYDAARRRLLVGDWKSQGYAYGPHTSYQLRFLAMAAAGVWPADEVEVQVFYLGDAGSVGMSGGVFDLIELDAFGQELRGLMRNPPESWVEGPHCRHCPSFEYCPAKTRLALQVATGEPIEGPLSMLPLTPERAAMVWERLGEAERFLEHLRRAVMACVKEKGALRLSSGRMLGEVEKLGNEALDGKVVHRVLEERYGREVADAAVELEATKVGLRRALKLAWDPGLRSIAKRESAVLAEVRAQGGAKRELKRTIAEYDPDSIDHLELPS